MLLKDVSSISTSQEPITNWKSQEAYNVQGRKDGCDNASLNSETDDLQIIMSEAPRDYNVTKFTRLMTWSVSVEVIFLRD